MVKSEAWCVRCQCLRKTIYHINQTCLMNPQRRCVTLQFVIITQFVIHYKLRWIATQFVIHRISNCVVRATRFVMYYKLRQNFIILKYWKGEKNWSTDRFNNILLWIQLDTNLFKLGMQNSQSTHLVRTLFCPRTFAKFGGGGALKPIRPSVYCLSVRHKTLTWLISSEVLKI